MSLVRLAVSAPFYLIGLLLAGLSLPFLLLATRLYDSSYPGGLNTDR